MPKLLKEFKDKPESEQLLVLRLKFKLSLQYDADCFLTKEVLKYPLCSLATRKVYMTKLKELELKYQSELKKLEESEFLSSDTVSADARSRCKNIQI